MKTNKTNKTKFLIFGLFVGLIVGLMAGLALMNPGMTGMSVWEAAGTIGRVDQYRNVRVTEADIELRNELLADQNMREAYRNYLAYEYAANIKMGDDLRFAISAGREHDDFHTNNTHTLDRMAEYAIFLDNARLRILEAIGTLSDLSDKDRVAIRTVLNSAGNAIAQTQFRNGVVFDFIANVESFFKTNPKAAFPQLAMAHDQLFTNMLMHNIINDNRPVLEHLLAKELMDEDGELAKLDMAALRSIVIKDSEHLKGIAFMNEEVIKSFVRDIVELRHVPVLDFEQLRFALREGEQLRILDGEQLRSSGNALRMDDVLRGSDMMRNSDFLRGANLLDNEQLHFVRP